MYAEIKDSEHILINRLSNNERILLQQIANNAKTTEITFSELTGETGDFDGVMIYVKAPEPSGETDIEVKDDTLDILEATGDMDANVENGVLDIQF